jgi:hypothetical protein
MRRKRLRQDSALNGEMGSGGLKRHLPDQVVADQVVAEECGQMQETASQRLEAVLQQLERGRPT